MTTTRTLAAGLLCALALTLAACGDSSDDDNANNGSTIADAFTAQANTLAGNTSDDTEPIDIDNIAATSPDDTEPATL